VEPGEPGTNEFTVTLAVVIPDALSRIADPTPVEPGTNEVTVKVAVVSPMR